ncbi:MAG: BrnA antitoxin family protein [Gemmatimonadota bacterium]|nr:BrnA antitoxin family protein [Gemmatimonadota bacterium]
MAVKRERTERYDPRKHQDRTDWARVDRLTDADIAAAVAADPDAAPLLTEEWFRQAEWMPPLTKKGVFLRLDPDVVAWFKEGGAGYQTRMNAVLRGYMLAHRKPVAKPKQRKKG